MAHRQIVERFTARATDESRLRKALVHDFGARAAVPTADTTYNPDTRTTDYTTTGATTTGATTTGTTTAGTTVNNREKLALAHFWW